MNLKQNSHDMATIVETFIVEETAELIYDNEKLDQWNNLVNELGLKGQTAIVKPEKSPIPFIHMKQSLVNIFKTLCPVKVNVEDYSLSTIPVEIVELIARSKREGYFKKIQIWYDGKNPDPVCVGQNFSSFYGHKDDGELDSNFPTEIEAQEYMDKKGYAKHKPYGTGEIFYLLGKWGDVKRSFAELKIMATERFIAEEKNEIEKRIKLDQRALVDLENTAFDRFGANVTLNSDLPF